jgi:hypothetical protein
MKKKPEKKTRCVRLPASGEGVSEYAGDFVAGNFYVKVGVALGCVPRLKALGKALGFKKAPVASLIRAVVLLDLLDLDDLEVRIRSNIDGVSELMQYNAQSGGPDPALN